MQKKLCPTKAYPLRQALATALIGSISFEVRFIISLFFFWYFYTLELQKIRNEDNSQLSRDFQNSQQSRKNKLKFTCSLSDCENAQQFLAINVMAKCAILTFFPLSVVVFSQLLVGQSVPINLARLAQKLIIALSINGLLNAVFLPSHSGQNGQIIKFTS